MNAAVVIAIIGLIFGSGGIAAFLKSRSEGKKIQAEAKALGEKTPAEVESISVSTMRTSLESSQSQVKALQLEATEREARHNKERQEWVSERATMRAEFDAMEAKLRAALDELLALKSRHGMVDGS